jgi:ATP-binding cassette subfamily B protein
MRGKLIVASISIVALMVAELLEPWPFKIIFDYVLLNRPLPHVLGILTPLLERGPWAAVLWISLAIVGIALVQAGASYLQIFCTSRIGYEMAYGLRRELFTHLQRLSLSFYNRERSGELLTKLTADTTALSELFRDAMVEISTHPLVLLGMFALMFALNWQLGLIVLATLVPLFFALFFLFRRVKLSVRTQRVQEGKIASRISETLSSVALVKAFGRERYEAELFDAESARTRDESVRAARMEAAAARTVEIIGAAGKWAVVLFGSLQVLKGRMTPGDVLIFWGYVGKMYKPIRTLSRLSTKVTRASVSGERISEILAIDPEIKDAPHAVEARNLRGHVVFDHVSFDYGDGRHVLQDACFTVRPGQRVALVGASGTGKSTIVGLLLRLFDPQAGAVLVDDLDIRRYARASLRREIGVVLQDSVLMGATVRENIAYGKPDAEHREIVAAAEAANAHEFISGLEQGYDTVIGERGATLSGGQRQRIAIARALIRNTPILVLDEPLTGIDAESGQKIREALRRLMTDKTCLFITHDLEIPAEADHVLVLDEGRIVEQGTHQELLRKQGRYRQLVHSRISDGAARDVAERLAYGDVRWEHGSGSASLGPASSSSGMPRRTRSSGTGLAWRRSRRSMKPGCDRRPRGSRSPMPAGITGICSTGRTSRSSPSARRRARTNRSSSTRWRPGSTSSAKSPSPTRWKPRTGSARSPPGIRGSFRRRSNTATCRTCSEPCGCATTIAWVACCSDGSAGTDGSRSRAARG